MKEFGGVEKKNGKTFTEFKSMAMEENSGEIQGEKRLKIREKVTNRKKLWQKRGRPLKTLKCVFFFELK